MGRCWEGLGARCKQISLKSESSVSCDPLYGYKDGSLDT